MDDKAVKIDLDLGKLLGFAAVDADCDLDARKAVAVAFNKRGMSEGTNLQTQRVTETTLQGRVTEGTPG